MTEGKQGDHLGLLLKELLKEQSLSMRKLSELSGIDTATISRIINGKRKATPEHLQKFAECLQVPMTDLFVAAGFPLAKQESQNSDIHQSIDRIEQALQSSNVYDQQFSLEKVKQHIKKYEQYSQTEEGKETILNKFEEKLQKVGSIGPFISQLKVMYEKFRLKMGTPYELGLMGAALVFFILPVDVIPDYIFPIGFLDDAMAVQIVIQSLSMNK
ncbi:helix-turn-helix domain-containing protein [Heyndrickxia oleronia]|uniref:helix-turn-helix domain-containing protein n=1 Tax=Heyndrickxia oleronia TaxID=38875 RepID=UPI001C0F03BD|nr:helix-turn-helix domain-containing protein [Heyndrickxia oleronia]MBU5211500.1 helix-turn-helix domain-containing protein [Heyndrickxia oleronia]MCM3454943.1 helix-turn-helix domain-containing protein [Heyndrickxia oleronia]